MITDKSNIMCIYRILHDYTDETHILTRSELHQLLQEIYGRTMDRRTVYSCIEQLELFGFEIEKYEDNHKGYRLLTKEFSTAEIKLLIDAVYSCEYISKKQTEELLAKMRGFLSVYERKNYNYTSMIVAERKSPNPEIFLNIEILEEAITGKKKISFVYLDYDYDKKLKPRREKRYIASPYTMICESEHYYLVLIAEGHTTPGFYRIDMMKDIQILDERIEISKREAKLDSVTKVVYAHSGVPENIHLHCEKKALRYVIERFGTDTIIQANEDGSFEAYFQAAPDGLVYWALQYLQEVEVVSPETVRQKVIDAINHNKYK